MRYFIGMAVALSTLLAAPTAGGQRVAEGGIPWYDNYDDALAEAQRTNKPLLVEFRCVP